MVWGIRRLYILACFGWMGIAAFIYVQFLLDPHCVKTAFDFAAAARMTGLLMTGPILAALAALAGRARGIIPTFVLTLATLVAWTMLRSMDGLRIASALGAWFFLGAYGLRYWSAKRFGVHTPLFVACLLMLIISTLMHSVCSAFHAAGKVSATVIALAWAVLGLTGLLADRRAWRASIEHSLNKLSIVDWAWIGTLAAVVNLYLLTAQLPELASDAYRVWLPLLKFYQVHGGAEPMQWFDFSLYSPAFIHLLSLPYLLFGDTGTRMFATLLGILFLVALHDCLRWFFASRSERMFILLIVFCMPMLHWVWYSAQLDAPALAFTMGALAMYLRYLFGAPPSGVQRSLRPLLTAGLLLGFSCAGKLTTGPVAVSMALCLVLYRLPLLTGSGSLRRKISEILIPPLLLGSVALAIALPSFIQVYRWTGDPFFPMLTMMRRNISGGAYVGYLDTAALWANSLPNWLLAPYYLTFQTRHVIDPYLNGSFGPWLWLFFPFLPFFLEQNHSRRAWLLGGLAFLSWLFAYCAHEIFIRYNFIAYALLFALLGISFFSAVRNLQLRSSWTTPVRLGLSWFTALLSLFLLSAYGLSVLFNFNYLKSFLATHDRAAVAEAFWPGFKRVDAVADCLPANSLLAVLRPPDEFVAHLPRLAFEYRQDSTTFVAPDNAPITSEHLLRSSNAAAIITQELAQGWPQDFGWRDSSRLILGDAYNIYLLDDRLIEPHTQAVLPPLEATMPNASGLLWQSHKKNGANTIDYYSLRVPLPTDARVFSAVLRLPGNDAHLRMVTRDGSVIPLASHVTPEADHWLYCCRQGIGEGARELWLRLYPTDVSSTTTLSGSFSFFPKTVYPFPSTASIAAPFQLPTTWIASGRARPNVWHRFGPAAAKDPHVAGEVPTCTKHWIVCDLPTTACQRLMADVEVTADSTTTLRMAVRVERGGVLGQEILSESWQEATLEAGDNNLSLSWDRPDCPQDGRLVLVLWPTSSDQHRVFFKEGSVSYINEHDGKIRDDPRP